MFNDYDERPELDFMEREMERERFEEIDRRMDLEADEIDEKLSRF